MTAATLIDHLHARGVSVTTFLEALRIWEELPPEEREKLPRQKENRPGGGGDE